MALFNFLKKKDELAKPMPPPSMNGLEDLPPLDAGLPPLDLPPSPTPDMQLQPPKNMGSTSMPEQPSMQPDEMAGSSNLGDLENMDYSQPMPDTDHAAGLFMENASDMSTPMSNFNPNVNTDTNADNNDISQDINKLFIDDEQWKPTDVENFDPYQEEKIDMPDTKDFGELPGFNNQDAADNGQEATESQDAASQYQASMFTELPQTESEQESETEPEQVLPSQDVGPEQFLERSKPAPMELYVKGTDYRSVFSELSRINDLLAAQGPKITLMEDLTKHEDANLTSSKLNMEYLYKKLTYVDRRIFS